MSKKLISKALTRYDTNIINMGDISMISLIYRPTSNLQHESSC